MLEIVTTIAGNIRVSLSYLYQVSDPLGAMDSAGSVCYPGAPNRFARVRDYRVLGRFSNSLLWILGEMNHLIAYILASSRLSSFPVGPFGISATIRIDLGHL